MLIQRPTAFMITSHETEADFSHFFSGLKDLAMELDLSFDPRFFMQDAQKACFNSTKKEFPDAEILMCFYHVKENIAKHRHVL